MSDHLSSSADLGGLFRSAVQGLHGIRLAILDTQRARRIAHDISPSYVLHGPLGSIHLVYLFSSRESRSMRKLVEELRHYDSDQSYVEYDVVEPDEEYRLHDDDKASLLSGEGFLRWAFDEIKDGLVASYPSSLRPELVKPAASIEEARAANKPFFDAEVTGNVVPGVLDQPFIGSVLRNHKDWEAANVFARVRDLFTHTAKHLEGMKEGVGITACHLAADKESKKPRRKKRNVLSNGAFMFDFDGDQTSEEILETFERLGYTFAAYSSYNHLRAEGVHKLRVILPFERAFCPDDYGDRENYGAAVYRSSLDAFCEKHGLALDRNARDITRFMNSPRHPKGGTFFSRIHLGPLYPLDVTLPEDRPLSKTAKTRGVTLSYDVKGEAYVADGSGVDFFLQLIGDAPGQLGFHAPIYRVLCSYFSPSHKGVEADVGVIVQQLRKTIAEAKRKPDRLESEILRYSSDEYLLAEVANARRFIQEQVAEKEAKEQTDKEHMDALISEYREAADPAKLDLIFSCLAECNRLSLIAYCRDELAKPEKGMRNKPVPVVDRFSRVPVFGPDGTLRVDDGYDATTRMILQTSGLNIEPVPSNPSAQDITSAKTLLLDNALADFPVVDDFGGSQSGNRGFSSLAHIVVMLLQQFARELYTGPTPFFFIDKPQPGTGASLLVDLLYQIVMGRPASPQVLGKNDEEVRKGITSKLMSGSPIIFYDNVRNKIHGEALATLGTADWWEDRILGRTENYVGPNRALTIFTGNNMTMSDEMVRRMIPIRLDARMSDPENRSGFVIPSLRRWSVECRGKLIWSCLVLVQNWLAKGKPMSRVHLASYENFAAVMGGILEAAGIPGFLGNLEAFRLSAKAEAVDESDVMQELLNAWSIEKQFCTDDAHDVLYDSFGRLRFASLNINEEDPAAQKRILGMRLRNHVGRQFNLFFNGSEVEVRFERAGQKDHSARWRLVLTSRGA